MPKKVSRDTPAGLEDCDGRCGAVPEAVWVDRFPEGVAASLGDDPGDSIGVSGRPFVLSKILSFR